MSVSDVSLDHVTKMYGDVCAVDQISLDIPQGTYCCLLGPSGCGKSSTLRMIAGHETVSSGHIRVRGQDITNVPAAKRNTAMMFQDYALFPHMTLIDNVAYGLKMRGVAKRERRAQAIELLDNVGLGEYVSRYPAQLSGGQRQRVALARALITQPDVLLLDEPLSALDRFVRVRMRGELRRIQKQTGITFVHVTHSQEEALALADLVIIMDQGRIEQMGTPQEVYDHAGTPFVASFIGDHNVLTGTVIASGEGMVRLRDEDGHIFELPGDDHIGDAISFSVRADHALLATDVAPGETAQANTVRGVASIVEYAGFMVRVKLDTPSGTEFAVYVPEKAFTESPVQLNQPVEVSWPTEDAVRLMAHAAA
jgi:putative spermidine/putrescine transport system ATP-binding protein